MMGSLTSHMMLFKHCEQKLDVIIMNKKGCNAFMRCFGCLNARNGSLKLHWQVVAKQHDDFIISGIDKNLRGPEMYTCGKFGCSIPDGV